MSKGVQGKGLRRFCGVTGVGEGSGMFGSVTSVAQRSSALALDALEQRCNLIILGVIALHSYATAPSSRRRIRIPVFQLFPVTQE